MNRTINLSLRYTFALYQIFGGLSGIWFALSGGITFKVLHLTVLIFALAFFSFSIYSGILLLLEKKNGFKYSLITQYLQVIKIKVLGYGIGIYSGLTAFIGFTDTPDIKLFFEFNLLYSSKIYIFPGQGNNEILLLINVIPILIILFLSNQLKKKTSPNNR